ncbi:MAG: hypothetical protein ACW99Q_07120, partial [Candidatus Kariarchaeaceae archaeon]|jgi:hypothetical protein
MWVDVLVKQVDFEDGEVTVSVSEVGDILTVEAAVEYSLEGFGTVSSTILAKINTKLGITEEYNLDLEALGNQQKLDVVRVDPSSDTSSTSQVKEDDTSESDDAVLPLNFVWFAIPMIVIPIVKRYR